MLKKCMFLSIALTMLLSVFACVPGPGAQPDEPAAENGEVVFFSDPIFELAIWDALGKSRGPVYASELKGITALSAPERRISDLTVLGYCVNLTNLDLSRNYRISDISPLASLTKLTGLDLSANRISDVSPLASLTNLTGLGLAYNRISDISPLASLTGLTILDLTRNQISNIEPLVANSGLADGDTVNLEDNPLSTESMEVYIPQLEERGVVVLW